jgi:hypothetical protein
VSTKRMSPRSPSTTLLKMMMFAAPRSKLHQRDVSQRTVIPIFLPLSSSFSASCSYSLPNGRGIN